MHLPSGITRNVFWLGLVSFFTDTSSEMLYPIVPIFLTTTLGASPAIVGTIEGLAEATASLLKIWSGWLSDKLGVRRPLIFAGYGLSALTRPLLAVAYGWPLVLLARILDRFGKGLRGAPRDALLADSVNPEFRGRAFGFHRSMDQLGAVAGPSIGLALLAYFAGDYRALFLAAFIPSAISVAVVSFVRDVPADAVRPLPRLSLRNLDRRLLRFLAVAGLFSLGNSSDVFLILRAKDIGVSTEGTIALFIAFNVAYVLSAYPAGALSDRVPREAVFAAGLLVFAGVYLGFALTTSPGLLWILFPIYGLYMGMTDGVSRALVADLAPVEQRATALGLHAAVVGIAAFPASLVAGLLWTYFGPSSPFLYGSALATLAAFVLWTGDSRQRSNNS